jgi:hypothetical protein
MPVSRPDDQVAARQILRRSIDEGLRDVFDAGGIEMIFRMNPVDSLIDEPRRLHEFLVGVFAETGALLIERKIAERLLDNLRGDASGAQAEAKAVRRFVDQMRVEKKGSMGRTAVRFAEAFAKGP